MSWWLPGDIYYWLLILSFEVCAMLFIKKMRPASVLGAHSTQATKKQQSTVDRALAWVSEDLGSASVSSPGTLSS